MRVKAPLRVIPTMPKENNKINECGLKKDYGYKNQTKTWKRPKSVRSSGNSWKAGIYQEENNQITG